MMNGHLTIGLALGLGLLAAPMAQAQTMTPLGTFVNSATDIGTLTSTAKFALSVGPASTRTATVAEIQAYFTANPYPVAATTFSATGAATFGSTVGITGALTTNMTGGPFCVHETAGVLTATIADCGAGGSGITALTGDVTASGSGSVPATLATVNANVGQFSVETVNAKGLVTAATNLAITGDVTGTASGASLASTIANNAVTNAKAAQATANTMKGNWTGSTANVADNAMVSCPDTGTNHLNYVSGTGITCGTSGGSGGYNITIGPGLTTTPGTTNATPVSATNPGIFLQTPPVTITASGNIPSGQIFTNANSSSAIAANLPAINTTGFENGTTYCVQFTGIGGGTITATTTPIKGLSSFGALGYGCATADVPNNLWDITGNPGGPLLLATSMGAELVVTSNILDIATGGITSTFLASSAVTAAKIASGAASSNIGSLGGDLTGTLPNPTVASVGGDTHVAFTDVAQSYTKRQAVTPVTATVSSSTYTPDYTQSNSYVLTLSSATIQIANPTSIAAGQCVQFWLNEDATGGRAVTWGTDFHWAGGVPPVINISASAVNLISTCSQSTSFIAGGLVAANIL